MSSNSDGTEPKALDLIEQAVHLLRRNSARALSEYYLGSLPFILALLYFWSDMSRNPMAARYCGPSSAGVALTFIWMKLWQTRFCRHIWCRLQDQTFPSWSYKRMCATCARQAFLHAFGVVALPVAAIIAIPFGWVYAYYQNLSVLDEKQIKDAATLSRSAREQAALWPGQNHFLLAIMSLFGIFVCLNLAVGIMAMPYLLKWIFGIETVFTLSGMRLLNTTFLAVLCGLTYLLTDPIFKTVYVLRCFYGRSRETGDDIRSALRPFLKIGVPAMILVLGISAWTPARADTEPAAQPSISDQQEYVKRLDDTITSVLRERRFAWRLPRRGPLEPEAEPGWIASTIQWVVDGIKALARPVGRWIKAFVDWLKQKMPDSDMSRLDTGGDYRGLIRWLFYALGFGLALLLIFWLARWLFRSRPMPRTAAEADEVKPVDLSDDGITADDLPMDQWDAMARDLINRNDLRNALRALYLSVLALLADGQRVTIARYKSNLDYARELARRAHAEPELLAAFDGCVRVFERVWYGMHPVSRHQVDDFIHEQQRIAGLVQ